MIKMDFSLEFNPDKYEVRTLILDNQTITYRAFEDIVYVKNPVDLNYQVMNIYVPESYYQGESIGTYTAETAPFFLPNTVGGYMPGSPEIIGKNRFGHTTAAFFALTKGYVVAAPGARGRRLQNKTGQYTGVAPACLVDLKAAIRYLRYNKTPLPGDTEKIISNGTSAGGALSSLLGSTGNHPDYEPYLEAIGAAKERDDIFAASCYCPITNLENADSAYEWQFNGLNDFHRMAIAKVGDEIKFTPVHGTMTEEQANLSDKVKKEFPVYLNGLGLKADEGSDLTLSSNGDGTFKDYVKSFVIKSAQSTLDKGTDLSDLKWLNVINGTIADLDFDQYVKFATRMKPTLAFDDLELGTPENELFGTAEIPAQHFTVFSKEHSRSEGLIADPEIVKLMNPMNYIGDKKAVTTTHWRIRHGVIDRDTSLAIPVILATALKNNGYEVDFSLPWGQTHGGDYDLEELFAWIAHITR